MIGRTMGMYFAAQFVKNVAMIYLLIFFLILAVDLTDQARNLSKLGDAGMADFFLIALARAPAFSEKILPFATLFGSAITLMVLNKKFELVVARSAGISVWQFLLPAAFAAIALGLFSMMVYNPLALKSSEYGKSIEARVYGKSAKNIVGQTDNFLIREGSASGDTIFRARVSQPERSVFTGVTLYKFNTAGFLTHRIDASEATHQSGEWILSDVQLTIPGEKPQQRQQMRVQTGLTTADLVKRARSYDQISFWDLRQEARNARLEGDSVLPFITQFQSLLARPMYFLAMVLIAATVSLKFVRFGQNSKVILIGILSGFVLYVASELITSFGRNGVISPFLAVWTPAFVAALIGLTVLLHQEDG